MQSAFLFVGTRFMRLPGILLLSSLLAFGIHADEAADEALTPEEVITARLEQARPGLPIAKIEPSAVEGFYAISVEGGLILYANSTADFFFAGDLYFVEPTGFVNATEKARTGERKALLDSLDESQMIVFAPPQEKLKATITVFTDIDCGYCRKLHQEVPELNRLGIAVRYLAYPRAGAGSVSWNKAISSWCADNPKIALTKAKRGEEIGEATCDNPVAAHYELGGAFGVTGTPAVVLEDGQLQPGYLPAADMARRLGIN